MDTVKGLRKKLDDLPLDLDIIDGGHKKWFNFIADRMNGVREANIALCNDLQFESALPNIQ